MPGHVAVVSSSSYNVSGHLLVWGSTLGKWPQTVVLVPTSQCCVGLEPAEMSSEGFKAGLDTASVLGVRLSEICSLE